MTNVIVRAIQILGEPVSEGVVRLSASEVQPVGDTLIVPEYDEQELIDGETTFYNVQQGNVIVQVFWGGDRQATFRVHIPDIESVSLADLSLQKYDRDPAVVSKTLSHAIRAEEARDAALGAADQVDGVVTEINQAHDDAIVSVVATKDSSITAINAVSTAALTDVTTAGEKAVSDVDDQVATAKGYAQATEQDRTATKQSLTDAQKAVTDAAGHSEEARVHKEDSKSYSVDSEAAKGFAEAAQALSEQFRDSAKAHRDAAKVSETNAASSATAASTDADKSAGSATKAAGEVTKAEAAREQAEAVEAALRALLDDAEAWQDVSSALESVDNRISTGMQQVKDDILGGVGPAFDTLLELAEALGDNADAIGTLTNSLAGKADKDQIEAVFSRGEQAVVNGNGSLGMQYWGGASALEMSTKDAPPGTFGSYSAPGNQAVAWNDIDILIDPTLPTYVSGLFRQGAEGGAGSSYLALIPIDQDGNGISALNVMYLEGTLTELAEDLKPGDTEVKLISAENWQNGGNSTVRRIIFWDHISEDGKEWGPETYSRHVTLSDTWEAGAVDFATNTVTLRNPWGGDLVPAGTPLSNGSNGANYLYPAGSFTPTSEWTKLEGSVAPGVNRTGSGMTPTRGWPAGTTSVRVGVLMNYGGNAETSDTRFSNIHLSQVAPAGHDHASEDISDAVYRAGGEDSYGKVLAASGTGRLYYSRPAEAADEIANKAYVDAEVDTKLATKADSSHTHTVANVTGLQTALNAKAASSHTHTVANVTGLQAALDAKAAKTHTHTQAQVTGLSTALNGKADKTYVDSRPALFSGSGAPPSSIAGAVVGDWWLDESSMELHKITGV